jgi:hypothetical protein
LHLIIFVELFPCEIFLYVKKQVEMAGREDLCLAHEKLQRGIYPFRFVIVC